MVKFIVGNEGMWPGYVEKDLLPRLNGFELLTIDDIKHYQRIVVALEKTAEACARLG